MGEITVTQRNRREHTILFDDADWPVISRYTWCVVQTSRNAPFYAVTGFRKPDGTRTTLRMHVLLTGMKDIDHVNHNGLDNRRENLRVATRSQQGANMRVERHGSIRPGNGSKFKGVSWEKRRNHWIAYIVVNRKRRQIGSYASEVEAAKAYDQAALETWGEYAFTNFPRRES